MKQIKLIIALGIIAIMIASGMSSVSACYYSSPVLASKDEILVGQVEVIHNSKYDDKMYIKYIITEEGWTMSESHLAVATSLGGIHQTKSGNPKVGKFPYKEDHPDGTTTYRYTIDLDEYDLENNNEYHGTLFIAAHAVVYNPDISKETAWADTGQSFPGSNWALYFVITF